MRNQKGFSLIELLLVVAVILIISAIAIPSFLRSRMRANEASTVASLVSCTTGVPGRCQSLHFCAQPGLLGGRFPGAGT